MKTNFQSRSALDALRVFARYQTHGGYVWGAVCSDGALLCEKCVLANYRQIFAATKTRDRTGWGIVGLANSGEHDSDGPELCANCNRILWGETE